MNTVRRLSPAPARRRLCGDSLFVVALYWLGFTAITCGTACYSWKLAAIVAGLCLLAVVMLTVANLRGVRSSAQLLSLPTFVFMVVVFLLVIGGLVKAAQGDLQGLSESQQNLLLAHEHHQPLAQMGSGGDRVFGLVRMATILC